MEKNARDQIAAKIEEINGLAGLQPCSPAFNLWRKSTGDLILQIFGEGRELESFNAIFYTPLFLSCRMNDSAFTEAYRKGLEEARALLAGFCLTLAVQAT
ncbi:MAG: hypothetical protein ABFD62_06360 [Syntrophaceae bacterium]